MNSFSVGYAFGLAVASFAIAVILQFVLSKVPVLRKRTAITCGISLTLGALMLIGSGDQAETTIAALVLFAAAGVFWYLSLAKKARAQ